MGDRNGEKDLTIKKRQRMIIGGYQWGKEDLRTKKRQRMNYRGAKLPRKRGKVSTDGYPQTTERERNDGIEEVGMDQAKEKKANGSGG